MKPRITLLSIAFMCGATAMNSSKWLRFQGQKTIIDPTTSTWIVAPELKLLFCFIPKNACSQFNRVMNAMNGIDKLGEPCSRQDPNYKSVPAAPAVWRAPLSPIVLLHSLLADSTWTKGVFLRDPLDRLVSAFRSKCEPPRECGGQQCANLDPKKLKHNEGPTFDEWMAEFKRSTDQHFTPQARFCNGLSPKKIAKFNYVGLVTTNYTRVAEQVHEMMNLAWKRSRGSPAEINGKKFISKKRNLTKDAVDKVINTFFPMRGPDEHAQHNHKTHNFMSYYLNPATCHKAMDYYAEDYDLIKSAVRGA